MDLFRDKERLAKILAENPGLYNHGISFLKGLKGREVLGLEVESSLEKSLDFFNQANSIARDSDYFIFDAYDSWAEKQVNWGEGCIVYQKVGDRMIEKIGLSSDRPASIEDCVKFLKKEKVGKVFSLDIPSEGYFGLVFRDEDENDGCVVEHRMVDESHRDYLNEAGIEVSILMS